MFKRQTIGQLVVKPRLKPRTKLIIVIGLVTLLVAGSGWIYEYGLSAAGFERSFATQAQRELEEELQRQAAENEELRGAFAVVGLLIAQVAQDDVGIDA